MDKMIAFCETHGMKSKVNTLMFYADFPKTLELSLLNRVQNGEITEEQMKETLKQRILSQKKEKANQLNLYLVIPI